ncbi:MAG TPA: coenzyme F420-0:L-glutamate ligase [Chloroflexota bacterium]|nr:coenzyme F420-0:L-glutamate ligase [Chloroflexota bacterium]
MSDPAGEVRLIPVRGIPTIQPGDDLAAIVLDHLETLVEDGDLFVIAQKVISRAENRLVHLKDVEPGDRAREMAPTAKKDARLVELILRESTEVLRLHEGVLIVEQRSGWVCANAGIDRSNVPPGNGEVAALLPRDADASARRFAARIKELTGRTVAVVVNDSHGRAWREGSVGVAIGVAGMRPLKDERGRRDLYGYELQTSVIGFADEIAAAASLLMGQTDEGIPVVLVRGLYYQTGEGSAQEIVRPRERDLFR